MWLALFAGGLGLAAGGTGAFARTAGVGCVIFAVSFGLASERIRLEPLARAGRWATRRVRPVLVFVVGDWDKDVGFAGDGSRRELPSRDAGGPNGIARRAADDE